MKYKKYKYNLREMFYSPHRPAEDLWNKFAWTGTPQGFDYWSAQCRKTKSGAAMDPVAYKFIEDMDQQQLRGQYL